MQNNVQHNILGKANTIARLADPFKVDEFDPLAAMDEKEPKRYPLNEALTAKERDVVKTFLQLNTDATVAGLVAVLEQAFNKEDVSADYEVDPERILRKIEAMPRKQRAQLIAGF